ncbi:MAG: type II 3-dehydroquinate dehydratase [Bacteroidota bacterium]|nr:type II 3-dehydroquinate dehydratase [Bacteroidota bacterium]
MKKILVVNGPNLNLLHKRDSSIYGSLSLEGICEILTNKFVGKAEFSFRQTNLEGEVVDLINYAEEDGFNGLIINPGGFAHTSVIIRDALELCRLPKIEVHLSNLAQREEFRHVMITAAKCDGYISGLKEYSYIAAVYALLEMLSD